MTRADLLTKAETVALARVELCRRSAEYFVRSYVRIEDRDAPEVAVPFALWPLQVEALRTFERSRLVICLKARQLGLSWLSIAYAARMLIFRPGTSIVALSRREDDAKELVRRVRFILRHLPPWMIRHHKTASPAYTGPRWDDTTTSITVSHHGGEDSVFRALPASPDSGRSFTANLVILDEWAFHPWAQEIWSAAYPTINRPTGGQVIGISTGKVGTLFEEVWQGAQRGDNGFTPIFLPWHADPRRDDAWYEATKRALPKTYRAEYPATPEEAFTVGEGAAFPEWDHRIHVSYPADWYPPPSWKIVRAYDGGWNRACCKWYAIGPDGQAVCYREYYPSQVRDIDQAKAIVELSRTPQGDPERIAYTVADTACWNKQPNGGESTAEVFARNGVPMIQADKDRINGAKRVHHWLAPYEKDGQMTALLTFTEACRNSIRTYPSLPCDPHTPDDVDTDAEDHLYDCDRYFVMSRPMPSPSEEERENRRRIRARLLRPRSSITGY